MSIIITLFHLHNNHNCKNRKFYLSIIVALVFEKYCNFWSLSMPLKQKEFECTSNELWFCNIDVELEWKPYLIHLHTSEWRDFFEKTDCLWMSYICHLITIMHFERILKNIIMRQKCYATSCYTIYSHHTYCVYVPYYLLILWVRLAFVNHKSKIPFLM